MNWLQEKIRKLNEGRYGLDELGKVLIWSSLILYVLGRLLKSMPVLFLSFAGAVTFLYRFFSKQTFNRNEENCKFRRCVKLWKLKCENRKTSRIYMCPQCGQMIRVPKGKGKIQITCPNCKHTINRYS
jgi:DNA-directed RNA polymerase subunit RPC12/RpoP